MPVFTFSGKTNSGEKSGRTHRPEQESLASALRRERITPGSIREKGKNSRCLPSEAPRSRRRTSRYSSGSSPS